MIPRNIAHILKQYSEWFPVVSVTGPRQSGKSTLVQEIFSNYDYVNLELPGERAAANGDPLGYIRSHPAPLIIDEAQLAPELFNVIQVESDRVGTPGQYVLSGSQNFILKRQISQSLAGRVGMLTLLPLSYQELCADRGEISFDDFLYRGGYPRLYNVQIPEDVYYSNYVTTYLDRDVSGLISAASLSQFNLFLRIAAGNVGQLVNITSMASDVGVSVKTLRAWLSILEQSYIIFLLQPYFSNSRKRMVKTPKIYFFDTGLLCYLLSSKSVLEMERSGTLGPVFENAVIAERYKSYLNLGKSPELYFYRDSNGCEVDLVDMTDATKPFLYEINSSRTYRNSFMRHLDSVGKFLEVDPERRAVIMRSDHTTEVNRSKIWNVEDWLRADNRLPYNG